MRLGGWLLAGLSACNDGVGPVGDDTGAEDSPLDSESVDSELDSEVDSEAPDTDGGPPQNAWEWSFHSADPECGDRSWVFPSLPQENGHWLLERLDAPADPFWVDSVVYWMDHTDECDAGVEHRVRLYISDQGNPGVNPTFAAETTVALSSPTAGFNSVEASFGEPVAVNAGDHLFVAIEMLGSSEAYSCVGLCGLEPSPSTLWSNSANPPFDWEEMSSFDLDGAVGLEGRGRVAPDAVEVECGDDSDGDSDGMTDCDDPDCTYEQACLHCPDEDLGNGMDDLISGTLEEAGNDLTISCEEQAAWDLTYSWTAPYQGHFRFTAESAGIEPILAVFDECFGEELACELNPSEVDLWLDEGQPVVLVVQPDPGNWTAQEFTITVQDLQ